MHQFTMVAQGFDLSIIQLHVLEVCLELHRRGLRSKTKLAASPDTEESEIVVEQIESLVKICENMWTLWTDYLMLAVWTPFSRNIGYIFAIYIYIPAGTMKFFWSEHVFLVPHPKLCPSFIVVCGFPSLIHWTCPCTRQESNPIIFFWGEVPFCCGYINVIFWWSKHAFIDDQMIAHVFVVNSSSLLFQSFFAGGKTSLLVERHLLLLQFSCKFGSQ